MISGALANQTAWIRAKQPNAPIITCVRKKSFRRGEERRGDKKEGRGEERRGEEHGVVCTAAVSDSSSKQIYWGTMRKVLRHLRALRLP